MHFKVDYWRVSKFSPLPQGFFLIQQYQLVLLETFLLFPLPIPFWSALLKMQIINMMILLSDLNKRMPNFNPI